MTHRRSLNSPPPPQGLSAPMGRPGGSDMNESASDTPIAAGKQTPRRLRRATEILTAAREVFLDKGFERTSVAEIAARVGVVEGLVYTYFPTKRDLLNEVLRGMYVPLLRDIESGFSRIHGLRSRLRFLIWRHLRVYVEEPGLSRLVLHEVHPQYGFAGHKGYPTPDHLAALRTHGACGAHRRSFAPVRDVLLERRP